VLDHVDQDVIGAGVGIEHLHAVAIFLDQSVATFYSGAQGFERLVYSGVGLSWAEFSVALFEVGVANEPLICRGIKMGTPTEETQLVVIEANFEACELGAPPFVVDVFSFHGIPARARRVSFFIEPFGEFHFLADYYWDEAEFLIEALVYLLGVIASVEDDVCEFELRVSCPGRPDQGEDMIRVGFVGGGYDADERDAG